MTTQQPANREMRIALAMLLIGALLMAVGTLLPFTSYEPLIDSQGELLRDTALAGYELFAGRFALGAAVVLVVATWVIRSARPRGAELVAAFVALALSASAAIWLTGLVNTAASLRVVEGFRGIGIAAQLQIGAYLSLAGSFIALGGAGAAAFQLWRRA